MGGMRRAVAADRPALLATLVDAFQQDPTWSFALPDEARRPAQLAHLFGLFLDGARRYDAIWLADEGAAVAVWIPPDGTELSDAQQAGLEPLLREIAPERADLIVELLDRFEAAHPHDEPSYYLTLLATRGDRRGEGLGMALLRHCLAQIDTEHVAAYLESSNPANDQRYASVGFVTTGSFAVPEGGPSLATMWRAAR